MYKRILCPVDGSQTSNRGLKEAIELAKDQGAKLRFIHVIDTYMPILDGGGGLTMVDMVETLKKNAEEVIQQANNAAKKAGIKSNSIITEILGGSPSTEIIKQSKDWSADIIVMGTHGLRGFSRIVMGSDAEQVIRTSVIPVLLVNSAKL
jgi:nucleotide-binding universal stress UspA family protein